MSMAASFQTAPSNKANRSFGGLQAVRDLSVYVKNKTASLELKQVEYAKRREALDAMQAEMAEKQRKEEERHRQRQENIQIKKERDLKAINNGIERVHMTHRQQDAEVQRAHQEQIMEEYNWSTGKSYFRQLSAGTQARQKAEAAAKEAKKTAQLRSGLRSNLEAMYAELCDLGDEQALNDAAKASAKNHQQQLKRLKEQRDRDSAYWQESFEGMQEQQHAVQQENQCLRKEVGSLQRKSKLSMMRTAAVEETEQEIKKNQAEVQMKLMEDTRERARQRPAEEWAAQHQAMLEAQEREAARKSAVRQAKAAAARSTPLVEWSFGDLEMDPIPYKASRTVGRSTTPQLLTEDPRERRKQVVADVAAQKNRQKKDREILQEVLQAECGPADTVPHKTKAPQLHQTASTQKLVSLRRPTTPTVSSLPSQLLDMASWEPSI